MKSVAALDSWFHEHNDDFVSRCIELEFKDAG